MQKPLIILLLLIFKLTFGQNHSESIGTIEVEIIGHNFIQNSDGELTKRKTNRKKRPYLKMYFDSTGTLLKSVSFGKHHNTDLRLTNKIIVYEYVNGNLTKSVEYESDYEKNIYPNWKSKYIYNKKGELIDESTYYYKTDSLFFKTTYEYDLNSNKIKSIFNPTYYYQREFDSLNRITALKQIHDNKLRWDWNYTYSGSKRIGIFQTYYKEDKDYSKKEKQTFNSKDLIIETEELHVSKSGLNKKTKIYYNDGELIKRIEYYHSFSFQEEYEMISYSYIKIKSKIKVDSQIVKRINEHIYIE